VADWDADSPRLRQNLINVLRDARERALRRDQPTVDDARRWHRGMMTGLRVPDGKYRGRFRGERGLETTRVWIGAREGVGPTGVARALAAFERTLQRAVAALDARYPQEQELDVDGLAAVIDLSAWAHAEWVRMHPFANGNGRTARIWANAILMRYGLPPAVRLRPRPGGGYGLAGAAAMDGDWRPTAAVFRTMLEEVLSERGP
jgi:hypothetical protein